MKIKHLAKIIVCASLAVMLVVPSVFGAWIYHEDPIDKNFTVQSSVSGFIYTPDDMSEDEAHVIERLTKILNNQYTTDKITNSMDYLINETIQVFWGGNMYADPYVGSMDTNYAEQINELFQDVLFEKGVSFILKRQDLNGDHFKEIAMYSTSDPLDCGWDYDGTVCVFVSVFTPVIDENKVIVGYNLVCESIRGFCSQVFYDQESWLPSFTTDSWADGVAYYHYYDYWAMIQYPDDHDYSKYNRNYSPPDATWWTNVTRPFGNTLSECLKGKIPDLRT